MGAKTDERLSDAEEREPREGAAGISRGTQVCSAQLCDLLSVGAPPSGPSRAPCSEVNIPPSLLPPVCPALSSLGSAASGETELERVPG